MCVRVEMGKNLLGIEHHIAWATPGRYSTHNFPCSENGERCDESMSVEYIDPSTYHVSVKKV